MINWTEENINRLGKEKDIVIARNMGITPSSVLYLRRKLGIEKYDIRSMYIPGMGKDYDKIISEKQGCSISKVSKHRKHSNIKSYRAYITERRKKLIRIIKKKTGLTYSEIGFLFGVSKQRIERIVNKRG